MEEAGPAAVLGRSRRRTVAGAVSIAVHGAFLLAVSLVGVRAAHEARPVALTPIQLVEPPPPPPPAPPPPQPQPIEPTIAPAPGTLGRRGHEAPRAVTHAPADPYADLLMHY